MQADPHEVSIENLLAHSSWVRQLAARLVADPARAEDVVQSTWLAALEHPPGDGRNLRAWLGRVVTNVVRQAGRGSARRRAREESAGRARASIAEPADVLAERVELQRDLASHVLALDEKIRETVILRYYEGLSCAEIARRTGSPEGTVRWRLKRGIDALRERLDDAYGSRRAWCLALLPIARGASPTGVGALGGGAAVSTLLHGVFAMHFGIKLILAVVVLAGVYFFTPLHSLVDHRLAFVGRAHLAAESVVYRPVPTGEVQPAQPRRQAPRETRRPVDSQVSKGASAWVSGRVVDAAGAAIVGALVSLDGRDSLPVRTDGDGAFRLEIPGSTPLDEGLDEELVIDAPGFLLGFVRNVPIREQGAELGEIPLRRAGAIEGRVVDPQGEPVEGAWVRAAAPERDERSLERELLNQTLKGPQVPWMDPTGGAVLTDREGCFYLPRVGRGDAMLWAGRDGLEAAHSGLVEVRAGEVASGVLLELGEVDAGDFIGGVVLDPDGQPVPRARLAYAYKGWFGSGSGTDIADGDGRFRLSYSPRIPRRIHASDPEARYGSVVVEGVEGGDDVVLRLTAPVWVRVEVRGPAGPVSDARVWVVDAEEGRILGGARPIDAGAGEARFVLPSEPFRIQVDCEGFELAELGPFDGLAAPNLIRVDLVPLPGVRGRVLAAGVPVGGSEVSLVPAADSETKVNGFPVFIRPWGAVKGSTAEDGSFALTLREGGAYYLRAEADGYAPAELGPLELDPRVGAADLEIALGRGGSIEGIVLAPAGQSPAGTIVAVSRGDGRARTQRVGADGRYRFDHLTPGPWLVVRRDESIDPNAISSEETPRGFDPSALHFNCEVREGEVTHHDLNLAGDAAPVRLLGSLQVDGAAPQHFRVALTRPDGVRMAEGRGQDPGGVSDDGTFELAAPAPGPYRLLFEIAESGILWSREVELGPGRNTWSASVRTGGVVVEGLSANEGRPVPTLFLLMKTEDFEVVAPVVGRAGERSATLSPLPVGAARIRRFTLEEIAAIQDFPAEQGPGVPVEVRAGETVRVSAPD